MMVFMVIFVALAAFLFGFLLGVVNEPSAKPIEVKYLKDDGTRETERFKKEYMNFLNYDGSEQE